MPPQFRYNLSINRNLVMADDRRILVIADTPTEMGQTILRGVVEAVARAAPGWQIDRYATRPWPDLAGLQRDRPAAGFVAHVGTAAEDEQIAAMGVPAVNTSNVLSDTALPRVCTDDVAAGRMAAEYLRGRGFERVYFHGTPGHAYMVERLAGVRAVLGEANVTTIGGGEDDLKKAVASAEPPIAVISTDDYRATAVCRAAAACGRSVPVDVAALGGQLQNAEHGAEALHRNGNRDGPDRRQTAGRPRRPHPPDRRGRTAYHQRGGRAR